MDKDERTKLKPQTAFNEKKRGQYIMRTSKTILSILHTGFDKMKQGGRVMILDEKSAEKSYDRLRLEKSDEGTYKIAFENEKGTLKDVLSPGNRWLTPNAYLRIFGKKFMKDMGFDMDKPKSGTKSKIPRKRTEQIERYVGEIDDNAKQFAMEFNKLQTSEDNHNIDDVMNLQTMKTKIKL